MPIPICPLQINERQGMTALPAEHSRPEDEWQHILDLQHGVAHRSDIPREFVRDIERSVIRGTWRRASRDVVVNHNGPLTAEQKLWVVVKAAPRRSALAGRTAIQLSGMKGFESDRIYVTIPCGTSMPRFSDLEPVVHYSRYLDLRDVNPVAQPCRMHPARALLDAAAWADTDRQARAILLAGVQQRLVRPKHLTEALPRRGPCLRRGLIEETIADAEGGIASVPERDFEEIRRQWGLATPARQRVVKRQNGRFYLDVDWEDFKIAAEIDGMPHLTVLNWDADLDRMNEIAIEHRTLLRFTSYAVRHRKSAVGGMLHRALTSRGWRP
jgi:hypothetical protein